MNNSLVMERIGFISFLKNLKEKITNIGQVEVEVAKII